MYSSLKITLKMFDFDGTLFDTSAALYMAYSRAIAEVTGKEVDKSTWDKFFGAHITELGRHIGMTDAQTFDVRRLKYQTYPREFMEHITPIAAAIDLTKSVHGPNFIVTTTEPEVVKAVLRHFRLLDNFDAIFGPNDCEFKKPSPIPYLHAYSRCGFCDEVLILEDSEVGLSSARQTAAVLNIFSMPKGYVARVREGKLIWE